MSLINDALKRARQSIQRKPPGATALDEFGGSVSLEPVYGSSSGSGGFDWSFVKLGLLALLIVGGIAFKVWPYLHKKTVVKAAVITPSRISTNQANAVAAAAGDSATNNNPIARAKRTFDKVHDLHAESEANYSMVDSKPAAPSAGTQSATIVPPAAKTPLATTPERITADAPTTVALSSPAIVPAALKLQAIFFRESNPTALLNGKSVGVGDQIDGARVKLISPQSVVLDYPSGPKELSLR
jgi:hypothetical protein